MLDVIWHIQRDFTKNFIDLKNAPREERIKYTKEMLLHLVAEIDEILNAIGDWKPHRVKKNLPISKDAITEEIVDAFKFLLNVALVWDISPGEFFEVFVRKSRVVERRYQFESRVKKLANCAVIDIDGVLTKYPEAMLDFLKSKGYNFRSLHEAKNKLGKLYDELKHEYRTIEAEIPLKEGVAEAIRQLKDHGFSIVLMTTRPVDKYPYLEYKTIKYLENNGIHFDYIHFTNNKVRDIKMLKDVKFVVEDDLITALKLAEEGYKVYWVNNSGMIVGEFDGLIEVRELREVLEHEFGSGN